VKAKQGSVGSLIQIKLRGDEQFLWSGVPVQGIRWCKSDWMAVPLKLLLCAASLEWVYLATTSGASLAFIAFGVPAALATSYALASHFFVEARTRKQTEYGVTNQRVIIVTGSSLNAVTRSFPLEALEKVVVQVHANLKGNIELNSPPSEIANQINNRSLARGVSAGYELEGIDDAQIVYELIIKARSDCLKA
jgi:hypothetical protein